MPVRIRCTRLGNKNRPFYRLIVSDSRRRRDTEALEILGYYDPIGKEGKDLQIDEELVIKWMKKGALLSDTTRSLLRKTGILKKWHAIKYGKQETQAVAESEQATISDEPSAQSQEPVTTE